MSKKIIPVALLSSLNMTASRFVQFPGSPFAVPASNALIRNSQGRN